MVQPTKNNVNPVQTRFNAVELIPCPYSVQIQGKNSHCGCFCGTELVPLMEVLILV